MGHPPFFPDVSSLLLTNTMHFEESLECSHFIFTSLWELASRLPRLPAIIEFRIVFTLNNYWLLHANIPTLLAALAGTLLLSICLIFKSVYSASASLGMQSNMRLD